MASPTHYHEPYFTDTSYSFFTLPLELRIKVYKMCLVSDICTEVEMTKTGPASRFELSSALLRTCRAVCNEAVPELYGSKVFRAPKFTDFNLGLRTFSRLARHCIKTIRIDLQGGVWRGGEAYEKELRYGSFMGNLDEALLSQLTSLKLFELRCDISWIRRRERYGQWLLHQSPLYEHFLASLQGNQPTYYRGLYNLMQRLKQRSGIDLRLDLHSREVPARFGLPRYIQKIQVLVEVELDSFVSVEFKDFSERWIVKKVLEKISSRTAP